MGETERTDSELLAAYARGDSGAFERLVAGHGGMVYAACLRVLGRRDLAEEAAQAVFLVLARKAGSVRGNLGAFLHGVARNVARRARESELARRAREKEAGEMLARRGEEGTGAGWEEVRPHLDEAVGRLPAAERAAVVMHYLEGRPRPEVAARLGVPEGTVASRLHRAVGRLRGFLTKRGAGLSAAALAGLLGEKAAEAACPAFLLASAGQIAAAGAGAAGLGGGAVILAKGALQAMFWTKVKLAAAVIGTAAVVGAGVPATVHAVKAGEKTEPRKRPVPAAAAKPTAEKALKWREIGNRLFYNQRRPLGTGNARFGAWWSDASYRNGWDFYAKKVRKQASIPPVDFRAQMAVAVWGRDDRVDKVEELRVIDTPAEVQIHFKYLVDKSERLHSQSEYGQGVLIAIDRRQKPVVFYENGKRIAEVLPFRRMKFNPRQIGLRYQVPAHLACRGKDEMLGLPWCPLAPGGVFTREQIRNTAGRWIDRAGIDFGKEMVLAAFKGKVRLTSDAKLAVSTVSVVGGEVRVQLKFTPGRTKGGICYPYDLVAVPRRDLPVVFYENGKRVAEVLPFRRLVCKKALGSLKARYGVYGSSKEAVAQLPFMDGGKVGADKWLWRGQPPDFAKEMVLAAFKGRVAHTGYRLRISKVSVVGGVLRVDSTFKGPPPGTPSGKAMRYPHDLVAVPRRDIDVVFYENGKLVARIPFKAAKDKELAGFLGAVKYAAVAAVGSVTKTKILRNKLMLRPRPPDMSGAYFAWERVFYGKRAENWRMIVSALQARFKKGDKILFCRSAYPTTDVAKAPIIKWTAAREKAVRFALAPGWSRFRCPWCSNRDCTADVGKCRTCGKGTASGMFKHCRRCASLKGQCQMCKRTVGPATRGVKLGLSGYDPRAKIKRLPDWKLTLKPGKAPALWLQVVNKAPGGKVPELKCHNNSLLHCTSLFFLVEGPGIKDAAVVFMRPTSRRATSRLAALTGSPLGQLALLTRDPAGNPVFTKPGTYTVRAVAGRLISRPVTVVVKAAAAARPVPAPVKRPPGAARTPKWKAGGNEVAAVDAASGKMLWKVRLRFPVGNVVPGGRTWTITSQDGRQAAVVDAASGKLIEIKRLGPAKPKPVRRPEVF